MVRAGNLLFRGSFELACKIASKVRFEVPGETKRKRTRVEIMTLVEVIIDDKMTELFLGMFSRNPSGTLYGIYKNHVFSQFCNRINLKTEINSWVPQAKTPRACRVTQIQPSRGIFTFYVG